MNVRRILASLLAAATCSSSMAFGAKPISEAGSRYLRCGEASFFEQARIIEWREQPSKLENHVKLRNGQGIQTLSSPTRILLYELGGHFETTTRSIILTRDSHGRWHRDQVAKSQIWIRGVPARFLPRLKSILSASKGAQIEALLRDKCLYASPTKFISSRIYNGTKAKTMEIETGGHTVRFVWNGMATPRVAALADIVDGF